MTGANTYPLVTDYKLELGPPWEAPASIASRVDEIWDSEKQRRGDKLTNGRIYALAEFRPDYLLICPSEYKYVIARRRAPALDNQGLSVRPLAVTGILLCADGLVLGRRGSGVANDSGLWEPAPAGGLSKPDPTVQVLEELEEELGIPRSEIISAKACGLVEDVESGVFDIVFRLETAASEEEVRAAHKRRGSDEYSELAIVKLSAVPAFLDSNRECLIHALRPMLRLASIS
jgi:hypothetical protein